MKTAAKTIADFLCQLVVLPLLLAYYLMRLFSNEDSLLLGFSQLLSLVPGLTGCLVRSAFYRWVLEEFHPTARVEFGALFSKQGARIGSHVYVGPYCSLGLVTLEADCLLGSHVQIPSGARTHGIGSLEIPIRNQPGVVQRVTVGRDSWIGNNSVVLADLAEQTVLGAGSVVTRALPARVIAAGNPTKVIRDRDSGTQDLEQEILGADDVFRVAFDAQKADAR